MAFCMPSVLRGRWPSVSNTFSSMPSAMAATCVVDSALHTTKASATAPSNPLRSSDRMFFPFLSSIAETIVPNNSSIQS